MPSALSYGCKCPLRASYGCEVPARASYGCEVPARALLRAKCPHALANLSGEFATIQTTEQALGAAE